MIKTSAQTWDFCLSSLLPHTFSTWFCASPLGSQVQTPDKSLQDTWTNTDYSLSLVFPWISQVSFEGEPGFVDLVINHKSSHALDDQGKWGQAYPKGLQVPEEPGNPELAADWDLQLKPRGNDNTHSHPMMGILCEFFFPAKSLWENLTSGSSSGASGMFSSVCFTLLQL